MKTREAIFLFVLVTLTGCTSPYLQVVIPPDRTEVQARAARLDCLSASVDPTSPRNIGGATMYVGGGMYYTEGSVSTPKVDWAVYKDCMGQFGYTIREAEMVRFPWVFAILDVFIDDPPRFVREGTPQIDALRKNDREQVAANSRTVKLTTLLAEAWVHLGWPAEGGRPAQRSTAEGRKHARRLIGQALMLDPSDFQAHYMMGAVLLEEGDPSGAVAEFHKVITLLQDFPSDQGLALRLSGSAHWYLAYALQQKGDLEAAEKEYRVAILLQPEESGRLHYILGEILTRKGDVDGAITEFAETIRLVPDSWKAHLYRGALFKKKGQHAEAAQDFREVLRLIPDTPDIRKVVEPVQAELRELER